MWLNLGVYFSRKSWIDPSDEFFKNWTNFTKCKFQSDQKFGPMFVIENDPVWSWSFCSDSCNFDVSRHQKDASEIRYFWPKFCFQTGKSLKFPKKISKIFLYFSRRPPLSQRVRTVRTWQMNLINRVKVRYISRVSAK